MNRIRKVDNIFQVLITPNIKIAPDSPILIGNWEDENLRNYYIKEFETLNDAQCEAFKHPDIDWYRIVINHEYIFKRLRSTIQKVITDYEYSVNFEANLMNAGTFKDAMFDRIMNGGERFNLIYSFTDIISFTITNPWSNILHNLSGVLEEYREHLNLDVLRIRQKKIVDGKIICLYGYTEFGTIYEIKLIPTILNKWSIWMNKNGYRHIENAEKVYKKLLNNQEILDNGPVLR